MKIGDGMIAYNRHMVVFHGPTPEVETEVKKYFNEWPENAYDTTIRKREDAADGRTTVEIVRRVSCD